MELVLKNINYKYKNKYLLKNVSLDFSESNVYGLTGSNKSLLLEIIDDLVNYRGIIIYDGEIVKHNHNLKYRREVALIRQDNEFFTNKVYDEMKFIMEHLKYENDDIDLRMQNALKLVGLNNGYLEREIDTLSDSEKTLINVSCNLLTNPKVVMFDEVFTSLDLNNRKVIIKLINKLKEKGKIVIISSNNSDILYKLTNQMIILSNGRVIVNYNSDDVFKDVNLLNNYGIDIPYLVDFTYKVKGKNVKLSYHKDILDLIKDVYKHV